MNKLYRQTLGKPAEREAVIYTLRNELEVAKEQGKTSFAHAIENDLYSLGEGDFIRGYDDGEAPKGE